ncbi:MAG: hxcR [Burkholderiaceae bacterium]|nr:hxcR [Burkholderiaceae bacterium]
MTTATTSIFKDTPAYAQGVASTLLRCKCVGLDDIARANAGVPLAHNPAESSLANWLGVLLNGLSKDEASVTKYLSQAWQIQCVQADEWQVYETMLLQEPAKPLPKALCEASQGVVLLGNLGAGVLKLGVLDASDAQALQRLAFIFHEPFEWRLLSLSEYVRVQSIRHKKSDFSHLMVEHTQVESKLSTERRALSAVPRNERSVQTFDVKHAPVVQYIQDLLVRMVNEHASDVHFEPFANEYRIRARIDGVLHEVARPEVSMKEQLMVRLKIMAQMDIAEKRVPQDGRIKLNIDATRTVDCRVSTLPTVFGEKIVVRFLNAQNTDLNLEGLGYEPEQLCIIQNALKNPHGMILMTGPTGSGKTVSLYACLNVLNQEGVNISTVEDPVEIFMHGVNQVNINEKAGIHFATALRAFLRQDPDILMVGEIRDLETADIAVKAAQTGHLVFSTLHTNDATMALTRLSQMGVSAYNVAASVNLIIAQRLVRKLCSCKQPIRLDEALLQSAGMSAAQAAQTDWQAYTPVGCPHCHRTGYTGRTGVFQVVPVSSAMQSLIAKNVSAQALSEQAEQEGYLTLRQAGLLKMMAGVSSLEEVMSVTL